MFPLVGQAGLAGYNARRGGRRAREAALENVAAAAGQQGQAHAAVVAQLDSELVKALVKEWGCGVHSSAELQRLCAHAFRDQESLLQRLGQSSEHISSSLRAVASLGSWGKHQGNINRELIRFLGEPDPPKPLIVDMPIRIAKPGRLPVAAETATGVLLPHVEFATTYQKHRDVFDRFMLGIGPEAAGSLPEFWQGCLDRGDPRLAGHPMRARQDWQSTAVPIALHGDAVPCIAVGKPGTKSMDCISWQSLMASGATIDLKRLAFCIFEHSKSRDGTTMRQAWRILLWSFEALFAGVWPTRNWDDAAWPQNSAEAALAGLPPAGGMFIVIFILKGDWDHFVKCYGFKNYNANDMCEFCHSHKNGPVASWPNNFRQNARWKVRLVGSAEWRALNANSMHDIFRRFTFLSTQNVEPDEMHCIHIGTSMYFLGSILWVLTYRILTGTPHANMGQIWTEIAAAYRALACPTQYGNLGLTSFHDPAKPRAAYPKLKGRAAEVKWLAPALQAVWARHMRHGVEQDHWVAGCLASLCQMQSILDSDSRNFFLEPGQVLHFRTLVDQHLSLYSRLAAAADSVGDLLWTVAPKHHLMWHLAWKSQYLHPRRGSCYQDEDFMRRMKGMVQGCTASNAMHKVPLAVLHKYRWGMFFQYLNVREE